MYKYRISKYNPIFRDERGAFLREEWTSECDIGKTFEGKLFTADEYLETESNYIRAIFLFLDLHKIGYLNIKNIEFSGYEYFLESIKKNRLQYSDDLLKMCKDAESLKVLKIKQIESFCKLALREQIWSELYYPRKLRIHFGYDYLLGITSSVSIKKLKIKLKH